MLFTESAWFMLFHNMLFYNRVPMKYLSKIYRNSEVKIKE